MPRGWRPRFGLVPGLLLFGAPALSAQAPVSGEVRQLVTFAFLPGKAAEALDLYRTTAVPLYERDAAMLSFRAFREVESPVALDLVVVRGFRGMAGMDASNEALRELARSAGTDMRALYGRIGALTAGHTDQFVEMLPRLGSGDPASRRLTAFVWHRIRPGTALAFERSLTRLTGPSAGGPPSATGRMLIADGWDYLSFVGVDSLGEFQAFHDRLTADAGLAELTAARRVAILAVVPELSVR